MSVQIGVIEPVATTEEGLHAKVHVWASRGGVEVHMDNPTSLDPIQARNLAALLVRAGDEVERMRACPDEIRAYLVEHGHPIESNLPKP